jgi:hypothetical protein
LAEPNDFVWILDCDGVDTVVFIDDLNYVWGFTGCALNFFVTFVANQQDVVVLGGETLHLSVNLGYQRAGGIDSLEASLVGGLNDRWRNAVSAEN